MSDAEAARHLLPEEENRRIFREEIVRREFSGRTPQERPTVVFLVGQPGAGKTALGNQLADTLNKRGGFIDVDSDRYKPFHPKYDELMARDDKLMAAYTRADGRAWMAQAHQHVRDNKLNAVIQETSQDGAAVAKTMQAYRQAGFRVEVAAMGVSDAMSNQGIVNRYHEQVKDRGQGRLTVQANADQSYKGILDLADRVDRGRLADQVKVFRRGETRPRYGNRLGRRGEWEKPPRLRAAIEGERARPWSKKERADFQNVQSKLRREMGREWGPHLDRVDRLARPNLATKGTRTTAGPQAAAAARLQARGLKLPGKGASTPMRQAARQAARQAPPPQRPNQGRQPGRSGGRER